ncbi:MAG: fructose-bisphosphatase class II [Anaerolineae bacterium]|nr:fructose-bisphosphatase class II [Anaerolineae bacterium]
MSTNLSRNLGLDLVRATEAAALTAIRWMGLGRPQQAEQATAKAMCDALNKMTVGQPVLTDRYQSPRTYISLQNNIPFDSGSPADLVLDPIDGRNLVAFGFPGAISVIAAAISGSFWDPGPAAYMEKLIVNAEIADALVPECLDAPAAWTLALVARAKEKQVGNLTVFMLDRPRHADLVEEIRTTGAHIMLRSDGDITGAVLAASRDSRVDIVIGTGGVREGLISACVVKAMGGAMVSRLAPQSEKEQSEIRSAGLDAKRIMTCGDLVAGDDLFFAATGITDGPLLQGIQYHGHYATSNSMILRGKTDVKRTIHAEHKLT